MLFTISIKGDDSLTPSASMAAAELQSTTTTFAVSRNTCDGKIALSVCYPKHDCSVYYRMQTSMITVPGTECRQAWLTIQAIKQKKQLAGTSESALMPVVFVFFQVHSPSILHFQSKIFRSGRPFTITGNFLSRSLNALYSNFR